MKNIGDLSRLLFIADLFFPFFFNYLPLFLFQPRVASIPVWVTAGCVAWARMSVDSFVDGRLAKWNPTASDGVGLGLWVHSPFGPRE